VFGRAIGEDDVLYLEFDHLIVVPQRIAVDVCLIP